ncbi:MAG TPA: hypothetical protein VKU41_31260 [Polyangiaceae bacterium]|nr:hypothetical protein [Polyangiaceae bacterium]
MRVSLAACALTAAACSSSGGHPRDGGAGDASADGVASGSCAAPEASIGPACQTQGRLVCDSSALASVPRGSVVTVAAGSGPWPLPSGGVLVDGAYQLVAETIFGDVPPDVLVARPGDRGYAGLAVECDVYNEIYAFKSAGPTGAAGLGGGVSANTCNRLTASPDAGDETSYTAVGDTLYLFTGEQYHDLARGTDLGTYEVVDEFVRLPASTPGPATPCGASVAAVPERTLAPGSRDPGCPPSAPAAGAPCSPQPPPLECEYGGDAEGRCTVFAQCARQPDGTFAFALDPASACPPNPMECPPTFAQGQAQAGSTLAAPDAGCPGPGISCAYPEGVCACLPGNASCQWMCRASADVARTGDGGSACPARRPLSGDACDQEGEECGYDELCQPRLSLGPTMACVHGNWEEVSSAASCPVVTACPPSAAHAGL